MATYSEISKSRPKKDEIRLVLAHFNRPPSFSEKDLLDAVERSASISPFAIRPHPKGAILGLRSPDDLKKTAGKTVKAKNILVPLTPFPELPVPVADRGRRWRISGVPFGTYEPEIREALEKANPNLQITCVKMETVRGRPSTLTAFASFWVKDPTASPTLKALDGQPVLTFDPEKKKKTKKKKAASPTPPAEENSAPEALTAQPKAATQPAVPVQTITAETADPTDMDLTSPTPNRSTEDALPRVEDSKDLSYLGTPMTSTAEEPRKLVEPKKKKKKKAAKPKENAMTQDHQEDDGDLSRIIVLTPHQYKSLKADERNIMMATLGPIKEDIRYLNEATFPPRWLVDFSTREQAERFDATQLFFRGDKSQPLQQRRPKRNEIDEIMDQQTT